MSNGHNGPAGDRLGLPLLAAQRDKAMDQAQDLERALIKMPARTAAGAALKLRLWVRQTLGDGVVLAEHLDPAEQAIVAALGDLERISGKSGL